MASANDGGGSIRIPAACCGLFGMKLSRGLVSLGNASGEGWFGAVSEGLVTRSVRDAAMYYDHMMGPGIGEPYLAQLPGQSFYETIKNPAGKYKIGYSLQHPLGHPVDEDNRKAIMETVAMLQSIGHTVEEVSLPYDRSLLTEMLFNLVVGETAADIAGISKLTGRKVTVDSLEPNTFMVAQLGKVYTAEQFTIARRLWNDVARKAGQFHEQYDMLLTPTLGRKPIKIGELQNVKAEDVALRVLNRLGLSTLLRYTGLVDKIADKIYSYIPYTVLANITGQPSVSLPLYSADNQVPVGVMFTGRIGDDLNLFRLSAQLERTKPWINKFPA